MLAVSPCPRALYPAQHCPSSARVGGSQFFLVLTFYLVIPLMTNPVSRYAPIDHNLFIQNRRRLAQQLAGNALAVVNANDVMPRDGDGVLGFRQHSDLFYLSGIDQEETILILYPNAPRKAWEELLFVKQTSPEIAIWEGDKYTAEGAAAVSGMAHIHPLEDFPKIFHHLMAKVERVYLNTNEHLRASTPVESRDSRFIRKCKADYPLHEYRRLAPIMADLRAIKSPIEIELLRKACSITREGFLELLPHVRPDVMEYELEASLSQSFLRRGSRGFAYAPIIASGGRANVLHYMANSQRCKAGELILLDVGAEYGGYNADLTRVIPVDGRFTKRQKEVYQAVYRVLEAAKGFLKPGVTLESYQKEVGKVMEEELLKLRLLSSDDIKRATPSQPAYKKYFMHGTSHHLGLGVHDFADMDRKLAPQMVLTVEPGIYIPEEGIGIRLENNVVLQEQGIDDLMGAVPLLPGAIEAAMRA